MDRLKLILVLMFFLCFTRCAYANPIVIGTGFAPGEMSALIAETLVVALLLNKHKFDFVRVLFVWIVVTLVTYWLFVAMLIPTFLLGEKLQPSVSQLVWITLMVPLVLIAEVIIILLEARIIRTLSRRHFFRNVGPYGFSKRQSIVVSVVVGLLLLGL